jgi:exodeoxyribonuclease VII large subunit
MQGLSDARARLTNFANALKSHHPERELVVRRNGFTDLHRRFTVLPSRLLEQSQQRFRRIEKILCVLGPDATLRRGYSITTDAQGNLVQTITAVRPKMKIRTRVSDGEFESRVSEA